MANKSNDIDVCETLGPEDDAVVKDLQRLISKVEEMKSQRNMLENQFRAEVQKDDITHRIVTQEGGNKQVGRSFITEYRYIQWNNPFFRSSGFGSCFCQSRKTQHKPVFS